MAAAAIKRREESRYTKCYWLAYNKNEERSERWNRRELAKRTRAYKRVDWCTPPFFSYTGSKIKDGEGTTPRKTLECNHPTFYLAKTPVNRRLGSMRTKIGNSDEESAVSDEEAKIVDKSKTNERLMKEVSRHRRIEFSRKKSSGRDGVRES